MKKQFLLFALLAFTLASCDPNYDFNKMQDKSINIGANLRIPIKSAYGVSIKDIMKDKSSKYIDTLTQERLNDYPALAALGWRVGDYYVHANTSEQITGVTVPKIDPITKALDGNPVSIDISLPFYPFPGPLTKDIPLPFESKDNAVEVYDVKVPDVVADIRKLDGEGTFCLEFTVPDMEILEGFFLQGKCDTAGVSHTSPSPITINYPKWLKLGGIQCTPAAEFDIADNIITLKRDVYIKNKGSFKVNVEIKGVIFKDENEESIKGATFDPVSHTVSLTDSIDVVGNVVIGKDDVIFPVTGPISKKIELKGKIDNFKVSTAEAKINPDLSTPFGVKPFVINKKDLPEFLSGPDAVLDLAGMFAFNVNVQNTLPTDLYVKTDMETVHSNATEPKYKYIVMGFDTCTFKSGSKFEDDYLQTKGMYMTKNTITYGENISLFRTLPDTLRTRDFSVSVDSGKWITTPVDYRYVLKMQCWFNTVLAFGTNLKIDYTYDMSDFSFELGESLGAPNIILHANILNSIPLDVGVQPILLEKVGGKLQPMTGVSPIDPIILEPGYLEDQTDPERKPSEQEVDIKISMEDPTQMITKVDGLRMELKLRGAVKTRFVESINAQSAVKFEDSFITTENGIRIDIK